MTEAEWNDCTDPDAMLDFLKNTGKADGRKLRLFAAACCRRVWHLLTGERSRQAVEASERYADGDIDYQTLERACRGGNQAPRVVESLLRPEAVEAAGDVALDTACLAADSSPEEGTYVAERLAQCGLLRDLFGDPFRPVSVHPARLKANKGRVRKLAWAIYDAGAFERLPELVDALAAAGCTDAGLLGHLRSPGPHLRGCHGVDAVLAFS